MAGSVQPSARALSALSLFATLGTLTEAAEQLGVARSALSHRIAELEKRLGVALVRKSGRRIALTEDGERLLSSMGDALDRIEAAVQPFRRDRGQIRLSTVSTFASHWLIPRIAAFQAQHPKVEVAILTTTRAVDLAEEEVDCAIRHGRGGWKGVAATLLFRETLMPIASPTSRDGWSPNTIRSRCPSQNSSQRVTTRACPGCTSPRGSVASASRAACRPSRTGSCRARADPCPWA